MGCIGFLIYRWNVVFNPSKTKALVIACLCFLAGLPFLFLIPGGGSGFAMVTVCIWIYAAWYAGVWFVKHNRDQRIIERAQRDVQRYQASATPNQGNNYAAARPGGNTQNLPPPNSPPGSEPYIEMTNEMNRSGGSRWFVPPPIDRRD